MSNSSNEKKDSDDYGDNENDNVFLTALVKKPKLKIKTTSSNSIQNKNIMIKK